MPLPVGPVTKMIPLGLRMRRWNGCRIVCDIIIAESVGIDLRPVIARMRITAFSPNCDGRVERRKLALALPRGIVKRPSWGKRDSAILRLVMILRREMSAR